MQKGGKHSSPSLRLINFVLHMYKQLTSEQRYTISVLLQKKCSLSFIAKTIGVCVSTVSREKRRNSNVQGVYDGRLAALKARRRKARTPGNRSISPHLRCRVFELIRREQWSPEQVSGWFMRQEGLSVSKVLHLQLDSCHLPVPQGQHPPASQARRETRVRYKVL